LQAFTIRPATSNDCEVICGHRRAMFLEMGYADEAALDRMVDAFRPWLATRLASGECLGWLALAGDGSVAAGLGLWLMDWPPHMIGPGARRGNILNVYTRPDSRRKGLARDLMNVALDWCRAHHISAVILHSSDEGRRLYESLGFQPANEMRLLLNHPSRDVNVTTVAPQPPASPGAS
jgi:GNAT superfamily N-acetyltransferase